MPRGVNLLLRCLVGLFILLFFGLAFLEFDARRTFQGVSKLQKKFEDMARDPEPYTMFTHNFRPGYDMLSQKIQPRPPGGYRVFVSGGSTVHTGPTSLTARVENELKRIGRPAQVYNFGVISQNSSQEVIRLVRRLIDEEPDLIVFYGGGNDLMDPFLADPRPGYPYNFFITEKNPWFIQDVSRYPAFDLLFFGSRWARERFPEYFLDQLFQHEKLRDAAGYATEPWRKEIAEKYTNNLRKISGICKAFSIQCAAIFQPNIFYKRKLSSDESVIIKAYDRADTARAAPSHARSVRDSIRKSISQIPVGMRFYDQSEMFDNDPQTVFKDYIHLTPDGDDQVAAMLARVIVEHRNQSNSKRVR
jgi:lysophospholipase L1-like esterase